MGYTQKQFDSCVEKITKNNNKTKSEAVSLCKLSLSSMKTPEKKEKPWRVVEGKDYSDLSKENNFVYFSKSEGKINTSDSGKLIKNIEIFKVGTFKGIDFKKTALEKMVANFNYLKAFNIFPNVPVRADHPSWLSGDIVDKIGGYIVDLKLKGNRLVADIRVTSDDMMSKIKEGTYISRSSEIGMYRDNSGKIYDPVLQGFAWVDMPAVEGLSPSFTFSQDKTKNLIELNNMSEEKNELDADEVEEDAIESDKVEDKNEDEEIEEDVVVEEEKEDQALDEETPEEEKTEEPVAEENVDNENLSKEEVFAKQFPEKHAELEALREDKLNHLIDGWVLSGKVVPAQKNAELAFISNLSEDQKAQYEQLKKDQPKLVDLDDDIVEQHSIVVEDTEDDGEKEVDKKADSFLERTK